MGGVDGMLLLHRFDIEKPLSFSLVFFAFGSDDLQNIDIIWAVHFGNWSASP